MRYLSVCSGIEAATVAWQPLGWTCAGVSEIERFPRAVLEHRLDAVPVGFDHRHTPQSNMLPLFGDFTSIEAHHVGPVDLLVGGTPCQSFSIAGLRGGLADDRGNLALEYLRLADRTRPRWLVWENVPGVLSSNGGRDFGSILGGMVELGYGIAYRVLDAQHFGVPQRRRRVFVVGYLGDWRRAAAVLFERHSLSGHTAPRREARKATADRFSNGFAFSGQSLSTGDIGGVAPCLDTGAEHHNRGIHVAHSLRGEGFDASEDGAGRGTPLVAFPWQQGGSMSMPIDDDGSIGSLIKSQSYAVAYDLRGREGGAQFEGPHDTANIRAASGGSSRSYIASSAVRRLTPRECARLQGFPDDWARIAWRGKPADQCPDGPQYRAYGNSMAVNVMCWLGERIALVDRL